MIPNTQTLHHPRNRYAPHPQGPRTTSATDTHHIRTGINEQALRCPHTSQAYDAQPRAQITGTEMPTNHAATDG